MERKYNKIQNCLIGTWSLYRKDGIYLCEYQESKEIKLKKYLDGGENAISASYICGNKNGLLYITDESIYTNTHHLGGAIIVFDPFDMVCKQYIGINRTLPCYIKFVETYNCLLVTNYGYYDSLMNEKYQDDVCVMLYKLNEQGMVECLADTWIPRFEFGDPKGVSRLHCVQRIANTNRLVVCDIGKGMLHLLSIDDYEIKYISSIKNTNNPKPRYCLHHPTLKVVYVNDEESYKVCAYTYEENNKLKFLEACNILDDNTILNDINSKQADMLICPNGKYLYSLCRSSNSITRFSINEHGYIQRIQTLRIFDYKPRCMSFSFDYESILVSCTENDCVLKIDIDSNGKMVLDKNFKIICNNPAKLVFIEV